MDETVQPQTIDTTQPPHPDRLAAVGEFTQELLAKHHITVSGKWQPVPATAVTVGAELVSTPGGKTDEWLAFNVRVPHGDTEYQKMIAGEVREVLGEMYPPFKDGAVTFSNFHDHEGVTVKARIPDGMSLSDVLTQISNSRETARRAADADIAAAAQKVGADVTGQPQPDNHDMYYGEAAPKSNYFFNGSGAGKGATAGSQVDHDTTGAPLASTPTPLAPNSEIHAGPQTKDGAGGLVRAATDVAAVGIVADALSGGNNSATNNGNGWSDSVKPPAASKAEAVRLAQLNAATSGMSVN